MKYIPQLLRAVTQLVMNSELTIDQCALDHPELAKFFGALRAKLGKEGMRLQVSFSNTKLGASIPSISLMSGVTCPEAGPEAGNCLPSCYDLSGYGFKPSVAVSRVVNTIMFYRQRMNFMHQMELALAPSYITVMRLEEGGDVPDQTYLDGIFMMGRRHPTKQIFLYTKSIYFNFSNKPDNVFVHFSVMSNSHPRYVRNAQELAKKWGFMLAYAGTGAPTGMGSVVKCPNQINDKIKCQDCKFCFNPVVAKMCKEKDIVLWFYPHGTGKAYIT
jgi:hypothetical protein